MTGSILIVDDEQTLVETISDHLATDGFDVASAGSAEEALELARRRPFDVVVTDLKLPGMSGLELLRALDKTARRPAVILTSAYGTMDLVIDAFRDGLFDFQEKPLRLDALSRSVERAVAARSERAVDAPAMLSTRALCERSRRLGRVRVEVAGDPSAAAATTVWHVRPIDPARTGFVWAHVGADADAGAVTRLIVRALTEVVDLGRPAEAVESIVSCLRRLDYGSVLRAIAVGVVGPNAEHEVLGASSGDAAVFRLDAAHESVERVGPACGERVRSWRAILRQEDALVLVDTRLVAAAIERVDDALLDAARGLSQGAAGQARRVLSALSDSAVEAPVVVAMHVGAAVHTDEPLHLRLAPTRAALVSAREAAEQFLLGSSLDEDATHEVVVAVQEALLNCMQWAYPGGEGPVSLTLSHEGDRFRACVRDEGLGFDVDETLARAGDTQGDPLRRGGRGLALMRACVDGFELDSAPGKGTRVVLEKRRQKAPLVREPAREAEQAT